MRRICVPAIAIAFFSALAPALAAGNPALDAPPPGLVPTTEHLATILAAHEAAVGRRTGPNTVIEDWRFTDTGISGTLHLERSGSDYHSRITKGPFTEEYGQQNGHRWHRDYNGFVSPTTETDDFTFYAQYVDEEAADPKNDASVAGMTQGSDPAYVVKVQVPDAQHPEWIFYDAATSLIQHVELVIDGDRVSRDYSDYRATNGITSAWHVHDHFPLEPELDDDYVRTSMQAGVAIDASQFAPPASTPGTPYSSVGVTLPAQMYNDGTIILRMMVDGRGLDMMLDTGVGEDIIDEDVARQLNLPAFGQSTRAANGHDISFETIIPISTIGPLVRANLAIDAEPFTFQWYNHTEVVGVLGYDFLANNVLKIDYDNATVQVLPVAQFNSDDPVDGGKSYPLDFDDGIPFISIGVGDASSDNTLLENEIDHSIFFEAFLAAHPELFTNKGDAQDLDLPFANNRTFGQRVSSWATAPSDVHFGLVDFQQPLVGATNYPLYFSNDRPVDAAIGFDFLKFFDLYLDYPHGRFIVKPNQLFFRATHPHA